MSDRALCPGSKGNGCDCRGNGTDPGCPYMPGHDIRPLPEEEERPCTCTLACIPQGLTPGQVCRLRVSEPSVSPADTIRHFIEVDTQTRPFDHAAYRRALAAVDEWEAVGERDGRQIAQLTEALAAAPGVGNLRWLAAVLDVIDDKGLWPDTMPYVLNGKTVELAVDDSGDAVQRELRAFADALAVVRAVLADKEDAE